MAFTAGIEVPTFKGSASIKVGSGTSIVFVGANGSGKTRLGVFLDAILSANGVEVHRIAAHRSLALNPDVVPPSLEIAQNRLFYGYDKGDYNHKSGHRFQSQPEIALLSDFDHVVSALYAENNDVSILYRQSAMSNTGVYTPPPAAKIDNLKNIWEKVLPHRQLVILSSNFKTKTLGGDEYSASEMSDGERVIFYLIAQALLAKPNTLLIFDEPELHINRSILAKLWDEIEASRPDCCFLYITHDIEFASSRRAATKFALREFKKVPNTCWDIELVPEGGQLPEDIVTTIVGSRRPVLFVEGDGGSLDSALYRRVYDQFTVIPVGSCEAVIQAVAAFAGRPELHRVGCGGLVDADGRTEQEAAILETKGVYRLPVSEVENLLLLPQVFLALAAEHKFSKPEAETKLAALRTVVFKQANKQIDEVCLRYTKRRVDAEMKKIGLSGTDIISLDASFRKAAAGVDPSTIFKNAKASLLAAINSDEYEKVLLAYDNKGLLSEAAKLLGLQQKSLEEYIGRILRSDESSKLYLALKKCLPNVVPKP